MIVKSRALIALIVAGALAGAGCSQFKSVKQTGADEKLKYQVIESGGTDGRIKVVNVAAGKAGDVSKASVEVMNDSNFAYKFEYRFKWYDANGMEINPEGSAWTPVAIMAHETKSLQATAPNPTGATFKLFLQEKQ